MKYETITLSKFLSRTLGLEGSDLKRITHLDAKTLFPDLKRSTFEHVEKCPEEILTGKIMMVSDGKTIVPYYVPTLKTEFEIQEVKIEYDEVEEIVDKKYDYADMTIYELKQLLNRKFNSYKNSREARKELEKRGIVLTKKYNRNEVKRMKEDEVNERN